MHRCTRLGPAHALSESKLGAGTELVVFLQAWGLDPDVHSGMCIEQRFDANISAALQASPHPAPGRVRKLKAPSHIALAQLIVEGSYLFDAIYIDGCHEPAAVLCDACQSWTLLEPGGILIFDDYAWHLVSQRPERASPKPAIDSFLEIYSTQLIVLELDYQCIVQKLDLAQPQHASGHVNPP